MMKNAFYTVHRMGLDITCGHRVVFHHVPKCGGTSVERALRRHYFLSYATFPLGPIYRAIEALKPDCTLYEADTKTAIFREMQLLNLLYQDLRCVAGHVYFSEAGHREFSDRYHFITTLREPIGFFRSFYGQMANSAEPRFRVNEDFENFLESEHAKLIGKFYALYFAPTETHDSLGTADNIERAKRNLAKCRLVGILEDFSDFEVQLRKLLGVRLNIGHANKSRSLNEAKETTITPVLRRKIDALSAVNFEIYEFARRELHR